MYKRMVQMTLACREHGHASSKTCTHCLAVRNANLIFAQLQEKRAALIKELSSQLTQGKLIITAIE